MEQIKVKIIGKSPLLHHSARLANPLDPATKALKALTSKRKKTDADHEAIAKCEWMGGLYWDKALGPYIPGVNLDASIKGGAMLQKLGRRFSQAVMVVEDEVPLQYKGPRDPESLFAAGYIDTRPVKVGMARVMRTRPKFNEWSALFTIAFDETVVDREQLLKALDDAGRLIGLCDFHPRYGKYSVEVM